MQIKGMQTAEGPNVTGDHLSTPKFAEKSGSGKQEGDTEQHSTDANVIKNGNGIHDVDAENADKQSNGNQSCGSPSLEQDPTMLPPNEIGQPLNFELGPDVQSNITGNNFWQMPPQEEAAMFQNFHPVNAPQSMPNYGLNNNNSFPQPMPFGSIGQPPSYMSGTHGQFSSPPGMHGMSMMGNMGPMNGPMSGMNYQNSHNQNQRRAITAQHNYGSMGGKPMNARFPWSAQQSSWSSSNQQPNISPWTMALQQQKAMNRGSNVGMGPASKKGQSNVHLSHAPSINHPMMPHKYSKRSSPLPNNMAGNSVMKPGYGGATASELVNAEQGLNYQNNLPTSGDSMKMDSLQDHLLDIMRHTAQNEPDQKGFNDGLEFNGEDLSGNNDQRAAIPNMNGSFPLSGYRPDRTAEKFSRKVFVGGLPPDIDEDEITTSFRRFGPVVVDWPHKAESKSYFPPKGYCFLLFQEEISVQNLIDACLPDEGKLYWCVTSPTMKDKPVQIRPWSLADSDYVMDGSQPLDPRKTIFVGGVPRPLRAVELALIIDRLYGGVCYAGIDTDPELKYPKGAGRVAFSNQQSYIAAISARFVQLQHGDIDKRVEVKPYVLDDQFCDECQGSRCNQKFAPFFCANVTCLQYYCEQCWSNIHARPGREYHKPLIKEGADRPRAVPYRWC